MTAGILRGMMSRWSFAIAFALALAGCGASHDGTDAGSSDAGASDAGSGDAGACADATEGASCSMEGSFCGGPCTDACSFCNVLECSGGTWMRREAPPAPCFACGDALRCQLDVSYCRVARSDVGGVPDSYACLDYEPGCAAGATCECVPESERGFCTDEGGGEVTVELPGG